MKLNGIEAPPEPPTVKELRISEMKAESALASAARSAVKIESLKAENSRLRARASREKAPILERAELAEQSEAAMSLELRALCEAIEKDAPFLAVVEKHFKSGKPKSGCVCIGCRALNSIASHEANTLEWKKKYNQVREDLRAFQGPPSKKKKGRK